MEFGIDKCGIPNEQEKKKVGVKDGYKYPGTLEANDVKCLEMKENIEKEYNRRIKKIQK